MWKRAAALLCALLCLFGLCNPAAAKEPIKWVDFTPTLEALEKTLAIDIKTHDSDRQLNWIDLLAYLAAKYGGNFKKFSDRDLNTLFGKLEAGESIESLTQNMKYFAYYREAYEAVLGEYVGKYRVQREVDGQTVWQEKYGLKVFSPIAKNFPFAHYGDFGTGRDYGYKRRHLGHDMLAAVGTPVIAVETARVEAVGWNQYGGWRLGLRSLDGKRYYYYAHLRKNRPYHADMEQGKLVKAGDVIGYVGRSGYSAKENTNNIKQSHLHFGVQLIFDESQKEGPGEIWIDAYALTELLQKNRSETVRDPETKEFSRRFDFDEELLGRAASLAVPEPVETKAPPTVPILMYHAVSQDKSRQGRFCISPEELENDLKTLRDEGYESVLLSDLAAFVRDGVELPERPVVLSFDDGNFSDYHYVFPLLKEYGMKAVLSIMGTLTDQYSEDGRTDINYPNLTWTQIGEMLQTGVVEIQNHGYDMHRGVGCAQKWGESDEVYRERLTKDLDRMQQRTLEMTGVESRFFTYPFGAISDISDQVMEELGFWGSMSCREGLNVLDGPEDLFRLKRMVRPHGMSSWRLLKKIQPEA